jgi:hypothetical protein
VGNGPPLRRGGLATVARGAHGDTIKLHPVHLHGPCVPDTLAWADAGTIVSGADFSRQTSGRTETPVSPVVQEPGGSSVVLMVQPAPDTLRGS